MRFVQRVTVGTAFGLALWAGSSGAAQEAEPSRADHDNAGRALEEHVHAEHGETAMRTPIPLLTDADRLAAAPPAMSHTHGDDTLHSNTLINRMEVRDAGTGTGLGWEAEGWVGTDINRLWWRGEGEHANAHTLAASLEVLFGHSFSPRWDWVAGLRQDARPRESRSFFAFGVQGLAPQWFEVSAMAFVGEGGRTAFRFNAGYSLLFTNRVVLQPVLELHLYGKDDPSRGIGAGLSTVEAGLRLRYEVTRQFSPYVGVAWEHAFGDTAPFRRAVGHATGDARAIAGVRMWF